MMKRLIALLLITTLLLPSFSFAKEDKSRRRRHQELDDKSIKETESETESSGTGFLIAGGLLSISGVVITVIALNAKGKSEEPITPKYKRVSYYDYYYGGYYTAEVLDTDALLNDAKARKNARDQYDTLYPIGISLLGIGIVSMIVGGAMADKKQLNTDTKNYYVYFNYYNNTPVLMLNYRF